MVLCSLSHLRLSESFMVMPLVGKDGHVVSAS